MSVHRVFIVGDSLFSETLSQLLGKYEEISIVGSTKTAEIARQECLTTPPDVFIITAEKGCSPQDLTALFAAFPEIPIICAELTTNNLRVLTSQKLQARAEDLISAITTLPKRR